MTDSETPIEIEDLGLIEYERAWKIQEAYAEEIAAGTRSPTLLLLEHPHVYTFGRRGRSENLLWNDQKLKQKGVSIHWVDRGGDVTYHGPGQLVGYPLIPLGRIRPNGSSLASNYVGYIRRLEKTLIVTLAGFGLVAGQVPGKTGVWIQPEVYSRCPRCKPQERGRPAKIAAIGVKVDARGVSRHGFALNVYPDMDFWEGIIACGLNEPVVSLADLISPPPSLTIVKDAVRDSFTREFAS
ncbi:MAG: lipoyl(octanoyl) transferase LipB [Chloroflexi bacterium]|nr:lipoyl(octanoyl) transferase LipB [Chloroflexota bacterium]